jgi:hypothetical protein
MLTWGIFHQHSKAAFVPVDLHSAYWPIAYEFCVFRKVGQNYVGEAQLLSQTLYSGSFAFSSKAGVFNVGTKDLCKYFGGPQYIF